jgi:RAB protein geranylgeranyltransferase component A
MESLPCFFDVAVIGTGLVESSVAAACARSGLRVLLIEETQSFGESSAAISFDVVDDWIQEQTKWKSSTPYHNITTLSNPQHELFPELRKKAKSVILDLTPRLLCCAGAFMRFFAGSCLNIYLKFARIEYTGITCYQPDQSLLSLKRIPQPTGEVTSCSLKTNENYRFCKFLSALHNWDVSDVRQPFFESYEHKRFFEYLQKHSLTSTLPSQFLAFSMAALPSCMLLFLRFIVPCFPSARSFQHPPLLMGRTPLFL